jgi:hypothetical protein
MAAPEKQTVFISHSSVNKKVTDELYQSLTVRFHLACWLDNFDLHTEDGPFSAQIIKALRGSSLLVLVDSPAARCSAYVQREVQTARDLQMPVKRCSISEDQAPWLRKIKIQWLALNIQLQIAKGFVIAALTLFLLLATGIFLVGTRVAPAVVSAIQRELPLAYLPTQTSIEVPIPSDPKIAAPFHFKPDTFLFQDDFDNPVYENSFNDQTLGFDIPPKEPQIKVGQQKGSLVMFSPVICLSEVKRWDCEVELDSRVMEASELQYFGFRARTVARTSLRGISVSISINEPMRSRAGFGWNFTDHAMAYFRSIPALPEKELYAYVTIDTGWHAYEILRDLQTPAYYYYIDGQLVDVYSPLHARQWDQAPLRLIIYSQKVINESAGLETDSNFELDELVIGGFNP